MYQGVLTQAIILGFNIHLAGSQGYFHFPFACMMFTASGVFFALSIHKPYCTLVC